jgi:hypothetical protein
LLRKHLTSLDAAVLAAEGVLLEGEILVGAEVVDPQLPGPGGGVEEEDVGFDALGAEDAGGQASRVCRSHSCGNLRRRLLITH